jgi:serine/threonine-protein kinase
MGEVYRARDGKLNRDVAIKVLPEAVAEDVDRLARFQREAQVLASLNHPHIAAIYGLEKSGNLEALVLELVEGETLAERIAAGPLPIDEALAIARQIADALEGAHERGIVHRDLKPANVKVTPDGKVKVLDFGLAKALTGDASSPDQTHSPTLTAAATQAGVVIGTAAYMSPEQARGRPADRRADIWAFGCVLYEMLTGRAPFARDTTSDSMAAILARDPDWAALPRELPAVVERLMRRCLTKDRQHRLRDIGDARLEIEEALASPAVMPHATVETTWRRRAPYAVAVVATTAAVAVLGISRHDDPRRHRTDSRSRDLRSRRRPAINWMSTDRQSQSRATAARLPSSPSTVAFSASLCATSTSSKPRRSRVRTEGSRLSSRPTVSGSGSSGIKN